MHYGDKEQLDNSKLKLVVYNHSIAGSTLKKNKDGLLSRRCVDYQVTSIQKCTCFSPSVLMKILKDPHKHLAKYLTDIPLESWILVKIEDLDGWGQLKVKSVEVVSEHPDELLRLH